MQTGTITLFRGDDAIIKGRIDVIGYFDSCPEDPKVPYFMINFIIRVNGKLRDFDLRFEMCEYEGNASLRNWVEWNNVFDVLSNMGYSFGESDPMRSWIDSAMSSLRTKLELPKF